jgi:GxxExxY protein
MRQVSVPIIYKGTRLRSSYRVDLIVEDKVVVEVKSVQTLAPVCKAQVLTYMRLTGKKAGLVINFNVPRLMDGVKRLVNHSYES